MFKRFFESEEGATMVEYGLMVALIAVVVMGAVIAVGTATSSTFDDVGAQLT